MKLWQRTKTRKSSISSMRSTSSPYRIAYAILHHTEQAEDAVSDAFLQNHEESEKIGNVQSEKTKHYIVCLYHSQYGDQPIPAESADSNAIPLGRPHLQVPSQKDDMEQLLANITEEETIAELLNRE
ncbi:MAG: hypothetical protein ACLUOF_06835 [Ruminococcus sp.]